MIYRVKARYKKALLSQFYQKLADGTIANQKPGGKEIVSSMKRAKITGINIIEWYEMCFCSIPLQHERKTVYDKYLTNITTQLVEDYGDTEGQSFWELLRSSQKSNRLI